jgi:NADH-quinone oxidoreductase subunit J
VTPQLVLFYGFGALAIGSAIAMVLNIRNTVAAALSLVVTMIALAAVFVLLEGHLVGAIQVMVYAGAIVVLFLFVVMLLNLRTDLFPPARSFLPKLLGSAASLVLLWCLTSRIATRLPVPVEAPEGFGGYRHVGRALFTTYILPLEVVSLLLLAAIVGAVVLAKRRID